MVPSKQSTCSICQENFSQVESLIAHMKTHEPNHNKHNLNNINPKENRVLRYWYIDQDGNYQDNFDKNKEESTLASSDVIHNENDVTNEDDNISDDNDISVNEDMNDNNIDLENHNNMISDTVVLDTHYINDKNDVNCDIDIIDGMDANNISVENAMNASSSINDYNSIIDGRNDLNVNDHNDNIDGNDDKVKPMKRSISIRKPTYMGKKISMKMSILNPERNVESNSNSSQPNQKIFYQDLVGFDVMDHLAHSRK